MSHATKTALPAALAALLLACAPAPDDGAARAPPLERCDVEPVPCAGERPADRATVALTPQPQPPVDQTGAGEADARNLVPRPRGVVLPAGLWRAEWFGNVPRVPPPSFTYGLPYEPQPGPAR